jgi:hypothetical protein
VRALRLALIALALAPLSCAGSDDPPVAGVGFEREQPARQLRCTDWRDADPPARREIIASLREFLGGPVIGEGVSGRGAVLEDDQAYRLFNARYERFPGFLLYKLYSHAAAFAGGAP